VVTLQRPRDCGRVESRGLQADRGLTPRGEDISHAAVADQLLRRDAVLGHHLAEDLDLDLMEARHAAASLQMARGVIFSGSL
jgi:hypothetical protein